VDSAVYLKSRDGRMIPKISLKPMNTK